MLITRIASNIAAYSNSSSFSRYGSAPPFHSRTPRIWRLPSQSERFSARKPTKVISSAAPCQPLKNTASPPSLIQQALQPRNLTRLALVVALAAVLLYNPAQALARSSASAQSHSFSGAVKGLLDFALHLDKHLSAIIVKHGKATYGILWAIVFAETGLVLTPFLPGDSLLFAAGAFAALGSLHLGAVCAVFISAAIIGDAVNYAIGNYLGSKALESNIIKKEYITKTEEFYRKYGGKTVVLARFVPIIRTFAPFVAGVGSMPYSEFGAYNVGGALLWTALFVGAGYFFGNLPFVQHNFTLVVLAIVAVSVLPIVFEVISAQREAKKGQSAVTDTRTQLPEMPDGPAQ
ncbi:g4829 [Coccomyxa elongata]